MNSSDTKKCPYCAEEIRAEAVKCRYCGSMLDNVSGGSGHDEHWIRIEDGKRIGGVCTGMARELNAPGLVLPIRVFFIITTFLSGFGLVLYALLWLLMPSQKRFIPPAAHHDSVKSDNSYSKELHSGTVQRKSGQQRTGRNSGAHTALIGLALVSIGAILVMSRLGMGWWDWPHGFPYIHMPDMPFFQPLWKIDMFPFPLIAVMVGLIMFVILVGVLRFFKVVLGCGLIAVSLLFLLVMLPFAPVMLNIPALLIVGVPVLILVGLILLIVGGIRLILG